MVTYPRLRAHQKCYANFLGKNLSAGVAQTKSMETFLQKTTWEKLMCLCSSN